MAFTLHVEENQYVKAGEPLISFDRQQIKEAGYDVTIPVIVTNTPEHGSFAKNDSRASKNGGLFILYQLIECCLFYLIRTRKFCIDEAFG